jgi:hypothetical protein
MNIKEIIVNEGRGSSGNQDPYSAFRDIGDFAGRVGSDIVGTGKMVGNAVADTYKTATDPETYKKAGNTIASGAKYAYDNPGKVAKDAGEAYLDYGRSAGNFFTNQGLDKALAYGSSKLKGTDYDKEFQKQQQISRNAYARSPIAASIPQTVDDAMRAVSNAATWDLADKAVAGVDSVRKGTKYDDEAKAQDAETKAAWERSPNASMAGTIGGSMLDPAFIAGAKLTGKAATKLLPKATTRTGKAATGTANFGAQTAGGFTGSRAAWDASDKLQGKPIQEPETVKEDELTDIKRLSGQKIKEGAPHFKVPGSPHVSAPHGVDIGNLDPNVRKAQATSTEPNNASYQDRVRAAQQQKDAVKKSGPVDPKAIDNPQQAAQQKQIQALSDKISAQEKAASDAKARSRNIKIATGVGLAAGGLYLKDKLTPDSKWANTDDYDEFVKKQHPERDAGTNPNKEQTPAINTISTPQNTDTDNGNMFSKETFKTNESMSELDRVKHLMNYRN